MSIAPISSVASIGGITGPRTVEPAGGLDSGFAGKVAGALETVSAAERKADVMAQDVARGGDTPVHKLMIASTQATLSVDLLVQVRNRAVEAYQEIMRMQV
jgi:flagellar hook-basal body complex protein FliE